MIITEKFNLIECYTKFYMVTFIKNLHYDSNIDKNNQKCSEIWYGESEYDLYKALPDGIKIMFNRLTKKKIETIPDLKLKAMIIDQKNPGQKAFKVIDYEEEKI